MKKSEKKDVFLDGVRNKAFALSNWFPVEPKDSSNPIRFEPNNIQRHFLMNMHNRNIVLKSRQLGFTTLIAILLLYYAITNPNAKCLFIADSESKGVSIFRNKVLFVWDNMATEVRSQFVEIKRNTQELFFHPVGMPNMVSSIRVVTSARGLTADYIHISELAKVGVKSPQYAEDIVASATAALKPQGIMTIESTIENSQDLFSQMFRDAFGKEPKSAMQFKAFFYNWQWDTSTMDMMKEAEILSTISVLPKKFTDYKEEKNLSDTEIAYYFDRFSACGYSHKRLRREFPTTVQEAFADSEYNIFDFNQDLQISKPLRSDDHQRIFQYPDKKAHYTIGVDVSSGVGRDSSAIVVMNNKVTFEDSRPQVVYTYANNLIEPMDFCDKIFEVWQEYKGYVAIERNQDFGVNDKVKRMIPSGAMYKTKDGRCGYVLTGANKGGLYSEFAHAVNGDEISVNDERLVREMQTYDADDLGKAKRNSTRHWDILSAAVICYEIRKKFRKIDPKKLSQLSKYIHS